MLKGTNISKRFGARPVLDGVTFVVNEGERAGLVGPNGCGKTTLLDVIAGVAPREGGSVTVQPGARVAYLRQGYAHASTRRVGDVFPYAFASQDSDIQSISARLAAEDNPGRRTTLEAEFEGALGRLAMGTADISSLWHELGLRATRPDELVDALSGGEQTKLGLIDVVASAPDVLLLDEPTNNLDIAALDWLDGYLQSFSGPVLIVSHDRALLDEHATKIIEIDPTTGKAETYTGDYSAYAEEKARRHADLWERFRRQQERERRMTREVRNIKETAQSKEGISKNDYYRRRMKKFMRRAVVLERRLTRSIESDEHIEKPLKTAYRVKAELMTQERSGDRMLAASGLSVIAADHKLLTEASFEVGWGERIVLLGANGSGKTTFLRTLLGQLSPATGAVQLSPSCQPGYLPQHEDPATVAPGATPVDIIRRATTLSETDARRFLHRFLFSGDDALTPVARLSYGERRRLALARLVLSGANLLVLDEPTNHLDIPSRESFESALADYEGAMLVVTHDRYFIERFADRLLTIEDGRLREI